MQGGLDRDDVVVDEGRVFVARQPDYKLSEEMEKLKRGI